MADTKGQDPQANAPNYDFHQSSILSLGTGVKYEDPKFHLLLIQKKELPSERPVIHSTKWERLAYYRIFTATESKTNLISADQLEVNSFLWMYAFNLFFKSLPHAFVNFFLAAYAPEEHLFVAKMVPFCHGIKYLIIGVGFLEMLLGSDAMVFMTTYTFLGIVQMNPWNRCEGRQYHHEELNTTLYCYELEEFAQQFVNRTHIHRDFTFINEKNERFQLAQLEFYRRTSNRLAVPIPVIGPLSVIIFLIVWAAIHVLVLHAWKRYFWRVLHFSQWASNIVDLCCFLYLLLVTYQPSENEETRSLHPILRTTGEEELDQVMENSDLEMLAESITAPPVVHVLTARSTQEIDPTKDSTVMILSNALIYIFRGLLGSKLKEYCEKLANTEIPNRDFNQHAYFYFWPIFWSQLYLGDIFSIAYISFVCVMEMLTIAVTYLCIIETVVYEWPKLKRWMVMSAIFVAGVVFNQFTGSRAVLWTYGKGIATLCETLFIYVFYPIARLVDDFTFHYGVPPTQLRILSIRLVPVYYIFKIYVMYSSLWKMMAETDLGQEVKHYFWSWSLFLLPIILGMLYIIYKYLIIHRATWNYVLRPIPKWGPRDFSVRQLRKQFDSRFYISSEVPRLLSRYLLSKRDSNVYKVDVRYDVQRRSTVSKAVGFGGDRKEKKSNSSS